MNSFGPGVPAGIGSHSASSSLKVTNVASGHLVTVTALQDPSTTGSSLAFGVPSVSRSARLKAAVSNTPLAVTANYSFVVMVAIVSLQDRSGNVARVFKGDMLVSASPLELCSLRTTTVTFSIMSFSDILRTTTGFGATTTMSSVCPLFGLVIFFPSWVTSGAV